MRMWSRWVGTAALAAGLVAGGPQVAGAIGVAYFDGPGEIGFENAAGLPPQFLIRSQASLVGLQIKQKVKKVKKNGNVFEVLLKLKVKNKSDETRDDLLVLLSSLANPAAVAAGSEIELELNGKKQKIPLDIVMLESATLDRFFAALDIGDLAPGKKFKTSLTYRVIGGLDANTASTVVLTAGSMTTVVPEPGTALLLGTGLLSLWGLSRRATGRPASRSPFTTA